jgi:hypothetical protein
VFHRGWKKERSDSDDPLSEKYAIFLMRNYRNKSLDNLIVSLKYGKDFSNVIMFKLFHLRFGGNKWYEKYSSYCSLKEKRSLK